MFKNKIRILRIIEIFIFIRTCFIIFYDAILPKVYSDRIYEFGIMKFGLLVMLFWILLYFSIGLHEPQYLKAKFTKNHISKAIIVTSICVILYLKIYL